MKPKRESSNLQETDAAIGRGDTVKMKYCTSTWKITWPIGRDLYTLGNSNSSVNKDVVPNPSMAFGLKY